jgi:hypothetical protein
MKVTKKNVKKAGITLLGVETGRRVSNGVAGLIPGNISPTIKQAGITLLSLVGAATYSGKGKGFVVPMFLGMATEQGGKLINPHLAKIVPVGAPQPIKDFAGMQGLGCGYYPQLNAPSVSGILDMQYNEQDDTWEGVN